MALTSDLVSTYRRPRTVIRRLLDQGENEGRALGILIIACFIIFVARWPSLSREAFLDPSIPLQGRMGGALVGLVLIAPLLFYGLAALSHLVAKVFKAKGSFYSTRLALFWSLFATTPLFLLVGLVDGFIGAGPAATVSQLILLVVFMYIWLSCLIEAETQAELSH